MTEYFQFHFLSSLLYYRGSYLQDHGLLFLGGTHTEHWKEDTLSRTGYRGVRGHLGSAKKSINENLPMQYREQVAYETDMLLTEKS